MFHFNIVHTSVLDVKTHISSCLCARYGIMDEGTELPLRLCTSLSSGGPTRGPSAYARREQYSSV